MMEEKIAWAMKIKGMTRQLWDSLLRGEKYISDNTFFCISRLISKYGFSIFLTKYIGKLQIDCKLFDIAVVYTIKTTYPCKITIDFHKYRLLVEYKDAKLIINQNLLNYDYSGNYKNTMNIRQINIK